MQPIKHHYGLYYQKTDGSVSLDQQINIIGIKPGSIIGFTYEVQHAQSTEVVVANEFAYHSDGKVQQTEHTVETNARFGAITQFHEVVDNARGAMTIRVSFPDYPDVPPLEQTFTLYDSIQGRLFSTKQNPPATQADIERFEEKYGVQLCDDYLQFLKEDNGLYLGWWFGDEFDTLRGAYEAVNKHGFAQTHEPFWEELREARKDWDWTYEVDHIFGLGNGHPYLDMSAFYMSGLFYHDKLVQYAYPVGQDGGRQLPAATGTRSAPGQARHARP